MKSWRERDTDIVWHPYDKSSADQSYPVITSGKEALLYTDDGRTLIDGISSWWVNLHGHCHPNIVAATTRQLSTLDHSIFAGFSHQPAIELAERILKIVPGRHQKVFYSDNGSTAVEIALKMAIQYWHIQGQKKQKILYFENAYHGDTFGAMAIGHRGIFSQPFHSMLFDAESIPVPTSENRKIVQDKLRSLLSTNDVAAFIFEPCVLGAGGFKMYELNHLEELISICKQHKVITIADEVMTGFGRTGDLFATSGLATDGTDIICMAKGLTGGFLPLAATTCSVDIASAFSSNETASTFFHGHSYTANPIACAAANASIDILITDSCKMERERITKRMRRGVDQFKNHPRLANVRAMGTIFAADLIQENPTGYLNPVRKHLAKFFYDRGVLIRSLGNVIYFMPPYCTTDHQLEQMFSTLEEYLDASL